MRLRTIMTILALTFPCAAWAHGDFAWINDGGYTAADGTHCCGAHDCVEVEPRDLRGAGPMWNTPYGDVDAKGVYQSRDGRAWVCRRQQGAGPRSSCAFVPGGG